MANAPFPINPELTGISIAYRNDELIADGVFPRVQVARQEFKFWRQTIAEGFTIPDTRVGRRSKTNEVEFSAVEVSDFTDDYGLDDPVPVKDIDNAPPGADPLMIATEGLTDLVALDREVRASNLAFALATYNVAYRVTLAGTDQWSDYSAAASDPIDDIKIGIDALIMRPNILVLGQATWSKLSSHPKIVQAINGNDGPTGIVRRDQVAQLFELEEVLVGRAFLNTAKKGQAPVYARVWGKHAALHRRDRLANPVMSGARVTFGFTAQQGMRVAGSIFDPNIGLRGGQRVRVGESVKELVASQEAGYFIQNAVA